MHRPREIAWGRVATVALVAVCVGYAPIAATGLWPYAHAGAPAWGEWLLSRAVSPRYVADAVATRVGPYRHSLIPMIVHSVLGGALMLLGPVQLLSAVRRRTRLHRATGVVFALTVYVSMAGAAIYLARTAPADAFSGAVFWVALGTILVGTVFSATFGVLAAVSRFPDLHQRWMLLCYGFLMTAPLLRIEWGALPWLLPGLSMEQVNQVAVMHLGSVVVFGALLASRGTDRRATVTGVTGTWAPGPVLVAAHLVGAVALAWIVRSYLGRGAEGHRLLAAYLLPYAATYALMQFRRRRADRAGRSWAAEEWRLHLTALCLAPAFSVGAAQLIRRAMDLDGTTALSAGAGIGCGVLAFAATTVVSLRILHSREPSARKSPLTARRPTVRVTAPRDVQEGRMEFTRSHRFFGEDLKRRGLVLGRQRAEGRLTVYVCLDQSHREMSGMTVGCAVEGGGQRGYWAAYGRAYGARSAELGRISDMAADMDGALQDVLDHAYFCDVLERLEAGRPGSHTVAFNNATVTSWFAELGEPAGLSDLGDGRIRFTRGAVAYFRGFPPDRGMYVDAGLFSYDNEPFPLVPE